MPRMKQKIFKGKKKLITIPVAGMLALTFLPISIGLLLGWTVRKRVKNKKLKLGALGVITFFTLIFGSIWVFAMASPTPPKQEIENQQTNEATQTPEAKKDEENSVSTTSRQKAKVTKIIDGDTIELEGGQRLRYIGMDTPEKGDCYSTESTKRNKELVEGKTVELEKDVSETDRYGRLLRYVYVGDDFINEILVKEGFASVYTYPPDVKYNERLLEAQKEARDQGKRLWSKCNSQESLGTQPTSKATTKTESPSASNGSCKYSCSSPDRDCSDFSTHSQAQAFFNCCGFSASNDPMRLDKATGKGNGLACESLP